MEFTTKEKKKLNAFLDNYEYLLEEGDYVTFLKKYREQNKNILDALYYAFVDLVKDSFSLNMEWFIKNDPDFYWLNYFESGSDITHINIPVGVTTITNRAFANNDTITSVTIPNSVTTIDYRAFDNCSNLTTVTISENSQLTTIGSIAFYDCASLTLIFIPNSVTTIGEDAFRNCSNLTIYCEALSKPSGWDSEWNSSNRPVVWGYKKE